MRDRAKPETRLGREEDEELEAEYFQQVQLRAQPSEEIGDEFELNLFKILMLVGFILAWLIVNSPHPPTPPSASAEQLLRKDKITVRKYFSTMASFLRNRTLVTLIVVAGGAVGIFNTIVTQLGQLMCTSGYPSTSAGTCVSNILLLQFYV